MGKKNLLAILILVGLVVATVGALSVNPELHKTFQIQILKYQKVDK